MHRTSQNGSYRLDRVFPGVGRIAVASGATTKEEYKKRNAMLTRLYDQGRLDLLRAIHSGKYTVTEVYAADRESRLSQLTRDRAILVRPLWGAVESWIGRPLWVEAAEKRDGAEQLTPTRRRYAVSFKALKGRAGSPRLLRSNRSALLTGRRSRPSGRSRTEIGSSFAPLSPSS